MVQSHDDLEGYWDWDGYSKKRSMIQLASPAGCRTVVMPYTFLL
jgi:hypothetical protein